MHRNIGRIIAQKRVRKGLSQKELASRLEIMGVNVSNQAVSKWENGMTQPNASQFLALCRALDVNDVMAEFTDNETYLSCLNDEGRRKVFEFARILEASGMFSPDSNHVRNDNVRTLPLYQISVSAGTGQFLDSDDYEMVEVGEEVPVSANFGVRIAGDSMQPRFVDGQIVWVRQQQSIRSGEIGIFLYRSEAFCKKFFAGVDGVELVSINKKYPPVKVNPEEELKVFGVVVG